MDTLIGSLTSWLAHEYRVDSV